MSWTPLAAQSYRVAMTVDDLPFVGTGSPSTTQAEEAKRAAKANHKLLRALARHHVPVTGFVVQRGVEDLGVASGTTILREWTASGFDLGNHTNEHRDFNEMSVEQFEDQVIRGEGAFAELMKAAGRKVEFFRFPFNHTGDTQEKHDSAAAFLAGRGYRLAPCTIETSDWMFARSYELMLVRGDHTGATKLRKEYLAFTAEQIDYFNGLNKQVWGYDLPQIMLIHDNQLNADVIEDLLAIFERKKFKWITLSEAESDPAYSLPDTLVAKGGPMWGYRWARERNVKVDGRLEHEPPKWVEDYGKDTDWTRRTRSVF
jgi:peptidoglycan/xylan/chitin deacetylase (PgdA/CDA1 family)